MGIVNNVHAGINQNDSHINTPVHQRRKGKGEGGTIAPP